jgi:hypothetical protein
MNFQLLPSSLSFDGDAIQPDHLHWMAIGDAALVEGPVMARQRPKSSLTEIRWRGSDNDATVELANGNQCSAVEGRVAN